MQLFGSTDSGHTFKISTFLLLTGLAHDYKWIDLALARDARPESFRSISKFGEVPVLQDEGQVLCQSNAILIHLAQKSRRFCGTNDMEWQSILEWLCWESNRIGFSVPNLRHTLRWAPQPPEVLAFLRSRAIDDLQALDHTLSGTEFLLQSGPSIADISCSGYLFWLPQAGINAAEFPHIERWLSSIAALPGWVHPDVALRP
jgi:glutathione S-transferase